MANSTDKLKSRKARRNNPTAEAKAIVGKARTVAKRSAAQQAKRTPGMNSTGRMTARISGRGASAGGPFERRFKPFDL